MQGTWDPDQYHRFRAQRAQPFHDLLALVRPKPAMRVADLGCGTGELSQHLHRSLQARETLGLDTSAEMLARSQSLEATGLEFMQRDLRDVVQLGGFNLVFSNAALQWLPDHPTLLGELSSVLEAGGQLAIQMPANHDHVSHTVAREVAAESPFVDALRGYRRDASVLPVERYAELLHALGFVDQRAELRVYGHLLDCAAEVVEWVRGTLLLDYLGRLPGALHEPFVARYRDRLLDEIGTGGPYFYAFKRILLWGRRP
ncbi:MAG: methyltransferase domain-containing protein [Pseudomonadota bacterium]